MRTVSLLLLVFMRSTEKVPEAILALVSKRDK